MCAPDYFRLGPDALKADRERAAEIEHLMTAKFERWSELDAKSEGTRPR